MIQDPKGKRALFDPSPVDQTARTIRPTDQSGQAGRHALFSTGERRAGTVVMRCRDCGTSNRVSLVNYATRHLPFSLWIPGKRYSRLLRCPACNTLAWQRVRFFV